MKPIIVLFAFTSFALANQVSACSFYLFLLSFKIKISRSPLDVNLAEKE